MSRLSQRVAADVTIHAENPGDMGGEAIPVPIPNTEVKLSSAEDTERAASRENRSSPGFLRVRDVVHRTLRPVRRRLFLHRCPSPARYPRRSPTLRRRTATPT